MSNEIKIRSLDQARSTVISSIKNYFESAMLASTYVIPYIAASNVLRTINVRTPKIYTVVASTLGMVWTLMVLKWISDDLLSLTNSITSVVQFLTGPDIFLASVLVMTLYMFVIAEISLFRRIT